MSLNPAASGMSRRTLMLGVTAAALGSGGVRAQTAWPTKPVTIVVPFPAGGGTDAFARPLFALMTKNLGKQFVIDNRGGAGGTVGASIAAKAAPDGYTFSWAQCTTPSPRRCTPSSTTTWRPTSFRSA